MPWHSEEFQHYAFFGAEARFYPPRHAEILQCRTLVSAASLYVVPCFEEPRLCAKVSIGSPASNPMPMG